MKTIANVADLDEARGAERAFVFLYVNWSIHARQSEQMVRQLIETWDRDVPSLPAPCYRVDLSEGEGAIWDAVTDWLTAQRRPVGSLMISGVGPLLWICNGAVAAHVSAALSKSVETLLAVTRAIFGAESEATSSDPRTRADGRRPGPIWPDDEITRQWLEGIAEARRRADRERYPWEETD